LKKGLISFLFLCPVGGALAFMAEDVAAATA
jgi:hypothetical protein